MGSAETGGFKTKSKQLALICGLVMVVLVFQVGLGAGPLGPVGVARAAPPPDLWIGTLQTVDSLNPYIGVNDASYLLYGLIYDYPFAFDQDGNFISNIVTNAVCTDASCMNWTYTVRSGVTWSDSSPLTVADVAFTLNYDSQNLFHLWAYEPYFNQVVQCTGTNKGHCGAVISGANQVTLYFQRPFAAGKDIFAPIVQQAQWSAVSPQAAETTYQNANPIGTGPFTADPNIYTEWQNQLNANVAFHLFKNPSYHPIGSSSGITNISNIYLKVYQDVNKMVFDFKAGTIQLAAMTTNALRAVNGLPGVLTQTPLQAIQEWDEIGISQIDTKAADGRLNPARFDRNVRLAMAHATNKDDIIQTFYHGQGQRGDSLMSPITPNYWYNPVKGGDNLTFDMTQAAAILAGNGWTGSWSDSTGTYRLNPNPITVSYQTSCYQCMNPPNVTLTIPAGTHLEFTLAVRPTSQFPEETDTANYLITHYAQIGIKIDLKVEATETALETDVYAGNVEMYIWYWSADPDPNYMLSMQSSWTLDGWSDNYWNNASYNHNFIAQMGELNQTKREAYAKQAQKIEYEAAVYIIYIFPYGQWAMRTDLWQGWGDWTAHPYRQMNAYWGANPLWFDLNCPTCVVQAVNEPPTPPVIGGAASVTTQTGVNTTFTATSTDPEATDTLNFTWDWGDGNASSTSNSTVSTTKTTTYGHVWVLNSTETYHVYSVTVRVSDGHSVPVYSENTILVNVTLPLVNPGQFQGTVKDTSSNPLGGAQVVTSPGGYIGLSASDGTYTISVPAGTYNLTAAKAFYSNQTKQSTVAAGATATVDFTLTPNVGWIVGTVTNSADGSAVQGVAIRVTATGGTQTSGSTDASGKYNVSVEPGTYTVNATKTGSFYSQQKTGIQVTSGHASTTDFSLVALPSTTEGISPLVIAAISLVVVVAVAAVVAILLMRRRRKKEEQEAKVELPPKQP